MIATKSRGRRKVATRKIVAPKTAHANGVAHATGKASPIDALRKLVSEHPGKDISPDEVRKANRTVGQLRDSLTELTQNASRLRQAIDTRIAQHKPASHGTGPTSFFYSLGERDTDASALNELESKIKFVEAKIGEALATSRMKTESDSLSALLVAVTRLRRAEHAQQGFGDKAAKSAAEFFVALGTLYAPHDEHSRACSEFVGAIRELDGCASQVVVDRCPDTWGRVTDPHRVTGVMQRLLSTAPGNREASAGQLAKAFAGA